MPKKSASGKRNPFIVYATAALRAAAIKKGAKAAAKSAVKAAKKPATKKKSSAGKMGYSSKSKKVLKPYKASGRRLRGK